jgi:hypothetical protein
MTTERKQWAGDVITWVSERFHRRGVAEWRLCHWDRRGSPEIQHLHARVPGDAGMVVLPCAGPAPARRRYGLRSRAKAVDPSAEGGQGGQMSGEVLTKADRHVAVQIQEVVVDRN